MSTENVKKAAQEFVALLKKRKNDSLLNELQKFFKMRYKTVKRYKDMAMFSQILLDSVPNLAIEMHELLSFCNSIDTRHSEDVREVRRNIYRILVMLSDVSEQFKEASIENQVTELAGNELVKLHPVYRQYKAAGESTEYIFKFLWNCAALRLLRPKLKPQIMTGVSFYLDPSENWFSLCTRAMAIVDRIDPGNKLHGYYYPDEFFTALGSSLGNVYYDDKSKQYRSRYDSNSISDPAAARIFIPLEILARSESYKCRLSRLIQPHTGILELIIQNSKQQNKAIVRSLLSSLATHNCKKCNSDFVLEILIKHNLTLESTVTSPAPEPNFPPPKKDAKPKSTKPSPVAAASSVDADFTHPQGLDTMEIDISIVGI